jgi:hypothetical protein
MFPALMFPHTKEINGFDDPNFYCTFLIFFDIWHLLWYMAPSYRGCSNDTAGRFNIRQSVTKILNCVTMHDFIVSRLQSKHAVFTVQLTAKHRLQLRYSGARSLRTEFQTRNKPVYWQVMFITTIINNTNINDNKTIVFQVQEFMRWRGTKCLK